MCAEAAKRKSDEIRAMEGEDIEAKQKAAGGLSVEAVTAHTQGAGRQCIFLKNCYVN